MTIGNSPTLRQKLTPVASFKQKVGNLPGPPGPTGPTGPAGPTGPQGPAGAGAVNTVFTRTGDVIALAGDYTAAKITNTPAGNIAAIDVQAALNEIDSEKVITPATNTANNVPQWNGANSKTLKDGLTVGTGANNLVQLDGSSKLPAVDGSQLTNLPGAAIPSGLIYGLHISNNALDGVNDIDIAVGVAANSSNVVLMTLASGLTKQLDVAWAVGTNAGMRASGAAITDTTYHIFLIRRTDTGVVDIAADTSVTGANITANTAAAYTQFRRIGSIIRLSSTILAFSQNGDEFLLGTNVVNINNAAPAGTTATLVTVTVPAGLKLLARMRLRQDDIGAGAGATIISSPDETDQAPGGGVTTLTTSGTLGTAITTADIRTDTSSRIRRRSNATTFTNYILTYGWFDTRGRHV